MTGNDLKYAGMQLTLSNNLEWKEKIMARLVYYCMLRKMSGVPRFRFEEFRQYIIANKYEQPKDSHAWGALPRIAAREKLIKWTGEHQPAHSLKTHSHYVKVWEAV